MLSNRDLTIYKPDQRLEGGLFKTFLLMFYNLYLYRELIFQLVKKRLFAVYRRSLIGGFWIILSPITGIVTWVFLRRAQILHPGETEVPYTAYLLAGTTIWGLFMACFNASSSVLQSNKSLILNSVFSHEVLFAEQFLVKIIDFLISMLLVLTILAIFGTIPSIMTLFFPIVVLPLILAGSAAGLLIALVSVVSFDISRLAALAAGFLMFLTPVIYSPDAITNSILKLIVNWNPMTYLVCSARDIILFGRLYSPLYYYISSALSVLFFIFSWRIFYLCEKNLAERMV